HDARPQRAGERVCERGDYSLIYRGRRVSHLSLTFRMFLRPVLVSTLAVSPADLHAQAQDATSKPDASQAPSASASGLTADLFYRLVRAARAGQGGAGRVAGRP